MITVQNLSLTKQVKSFVSGIPFTWNPLEIKAFSNDLVVEIDETVDSNPELTIAGYGADISATTTDDLTEGLVNLYFLQARVTANAVVTANTSARHDKNKDTLLDQGGFNPISAADIVSHINNTSNPHGVTVAQIGAEATANKGDVSGYCPLDINAKVPIVNLPGIATGTVFQGEWNASANTPTLADGDLFSNGDFFKVSTSGTIDLGSGSITFSVADMVIKEGEGALGNWVKIGASDAVSSVNGKLGVVVLNAVDIPYNNATSGLTAITTQAAIDENDARIDLLEGDTHTHSNKAILDAITNAGSGAIITTSERGLITSHASRHLEGGTDAIANATTSVGGIHSAVDKGRADTLIFTSPFGRLTSGGNLSAGAGLNLNFANGTGIVNNGSNVPTLISWTASSILLPDNLERVITVDSAGTVAAVSRASLETTTTQRAILGHVQTFSGAIVFIDEVTNDVEHFGNKLLQESVIAIGSIYLSGSNVTENVTALHLDVSSGDYILGVNRFKPSGVIDITFFETTTVSGLTFTSSQVVNNTQFDNIGVLTAIPTGEFRKDTLWVSGEGSLETYLLVMGQETFTSLIEAEKGNLPLPPASFTFGVVRVAAVIVQEGQANIQEILDARPIIGSDPQGVTPANVHGNLLGLASDNHPQYLLVSGTRAMTGSLNMGTNNIVNVGNIAIGATSPNSKSILDMVSITKGMLPPRMTTVQRDAITTPPVGLTIFNTDREQIEWRTADSWYSSAAGFLHQTSSVAITTTVISLAFNTIVIPLENVSINVGTDEFTINTSKPVIFHMEPQFLRTLGGGTETIVLWYEFSTDGGSSFIKGEAIFVELASGDSMVSPLTVLINEGPGTILRFRAQGTSNTAGLEFSAIAAATITPDHPIIPAYILAIR